ncbi:hypothetical protein ABPG74_009471 [Tetrahymena malaccensis]
MRNQKNLKNQMENLIPLIDAENQLSQSNNYQTTIEDLLFLVHNLTFEEFRSQNFERVKLYQGNDDKKQEIAYQNLDVILNQKICIYQQKEEQSIQKILSHQDDTIKIVPNIVNLRIRQTQQIDEELNIPQVELDLTQQQEQISEPHLKKSLTKQQLNQIKNFGYFYVNRNNSEKEKWKIQESFYVPKNNRKYGDSSQVLKLSLSKSKQILYNSQNILDYKQLGKTKFQDFSIQNFSLLQGVIEIISIPYYLCGIIFGVPMYKYSDKSIQQKITKEEVVESLKKQFNIESCEKVVDYLYKIQRLQLSPVAYIYEVIQKFELGEITLSQNENLNHIILIYCYKRMLEEMNQKLIEQNEEVQDIQNLSQFVFEIIVAQYFLNLFEFQQDYLLTDIKNQFKSTLSKNLFDLIDVNEFRNNNQYNKIENNDKYFWKLKLLKDKINEYLKSFLYIILFDEFGLQVIFCKTNKNGYETIYQQFQKIKNYVQQRSLENDEENENADDNDDGIFGPCCYRLNKLLFIYICKYFLQGIILVNIIQRLILIFIFLLITMLGIISLLIATPIITIGYTILNLFIYDTSVSFLAIETYPTYLPFPRIILKFFTALLKIIFAFFYFIFYCFFAIIKYSFYQLISLHQSIKNGLTYLLIYFFAQVPQLDTKYCKRDSDVTNIKNQFYQISFEQIKNYVDIELKKKDIYQKLKKIECDQKLLNEKNDAFNQQIINHLPFSENGNQIKKQQQFYLLKLNQNLKDITQKLKEKLIQLDYHADYKYYYTQKQFDEIFQQLFNYLSQKQETKQECFWQIYDCEQGNYKKLTKIFLLQIFLGQKYEKKSYKEMKQQLVLIQDNQNYFDNVNKYLNQIPNFICIQKKYYNIQDILDQVQVLVQNK